MSDTPSASPDDDTDDDAPELPPETTKLVDPKAGRRSRDRIKRELQERQSFWRAVLADRVGRREVWRLLEDHHTFNTQFACGPTGFPQPEATFHAMGQQQLGLMLYNELLFLDHDGVRLMHGECDPRWIKPVTRRTQEE